MTLLQKLWANRQIRILLFCGCVFGTLILISAWIAGVRPEHLKQAWESTFSYLSSNPWLLFVALVFLPGLPFPTSALLVVAGLVWGKQPVIACVLCFVALILNLTWTYWLAAGPGRKVVARILDSSGIQIPDLPAGDQLKLILILKLTPGIPLFFQNYLLGFLRAPFRLFMLISLLCNGIIGTGIVLSSVGIGGGKMMPALSGISLIVLGIVVIRLIRGWLAKRKQAVTGV